MDSDQPLEVDGQNLESVGEAAVCLYVRSLVLYARMQLLIEF